LPFGSGQLWALGFGVGFGLGFAFGAGVGVGVLGVGVTEGTGVGALGTGTGTTTTGIGSGPVGRGFLRAGGSSVMVVQAQIVINAIRLGAVARSRIRSPPNELEKT